MRNLAVAERDLADAQPIALGSGGRSVILVGAGIVNLVTALYLARDGYDVVVYERSPDPREDAHWTAYGCTRGGGDGRMFTLTEADSYNNRAWPGGDLLTKPISAHGWLVAKPGDLTDAERRWADDFHRMPRWLADSYTEDIFAVNRAAGTGWARLVESDPGLFHSGPDGTGYRDGILRLYDDADYYRRHVARNDRLGATRTVLTPGQVGERYPALAGACAAGTVAGGLEVVGFTVNIHKFLARLVTLLAAEGVRFHWDTTVSGIHWAAPGVAGGLETAAGVVRADHYVLSPGVYGDGLLRGTLSHERIQGMLGVWLTVPNVEPRLAHSVKIARKGHRAEETNVTLGTGESGEPVLICGSGYGWTGLNPGNIDSAELDVVFDALEDTVRRFFPAAHAAAREAGTLDASRRFCVRPWTSSCLGVFETVPADGGGALVVTGGHNTGGFTQSPEVGEAVLAAVGGRPHPMHTRFHPRRLERFYAGATPASTA
ncbi:MAG TPA: FAD-dependent oxidoreductase [Actinophytocola sp.]|nr:FAD-dependent oxidoreductase [Actinophytocola sp.]